MLVLSRKSGQSIVIGGEIVVNIVEIGRGRVQVGVSAPPHVTIHRAEIQRRIRQEIRPAPLADRLSRVLRPVGMCN